ncbi:hypothetical protein B7W85_19240 [Allorhizobium ampelinum]|nr:hypothetical protein B7W85_19240 [Allorhizobium ampelinum]
MSLIILQAKPESDSGKIFNIYKVLSIFLRAKEARKTRKVLNTGNSIAAIKKSYAGAGCIFLRQFAVALIVLLFSRINGVRTNCGKAR